MTLLNSRVPMLMTRFEGLRALILDWAGTTVDFGSLAPVRTLQETFSQFQVPISEIQARQDMGVAKRNHISRILEIAEVREDWRTQYGKAPDERDVDKIYNRFLPLQFACLARYSSMIPGVVNAVERARSRGLRIGSTTGYTRQMLDQLLDQSSRAGYLPDCSLSPEDVGAGRPHPYMIFEAATRLRAYPLAAVVKVGDTPSDIHEALNAGVWSVGVARTGNMVGLAEADFLALTAPEQERRLTEGRCALQAAGAHFVIDSVADLDPVLDEIENTLRARDSHVHE